MWAVCSNHYWIYLPFKFCTITLLNIKYSVLLDCGGLLDALTYTSLITLAWEVTNAPTAGYTTDDAE